MSEVNERKRKVRDLWQLHLPFAVGLTICVIATVIEIRRAGEGVERAWGYSFQWPLIAVLITLIWNRYRKHGNLTSWITTRYRDRIARFQAEDDAAEKDRTEKAAEPVSAPADPEAAAWQDYLEDLRRRDPPGTPGV
jgi:hypothetical protein